MKILLINSNPDLSFFTKRGLIMDSSFDTCDKIFPTIKTSTAITPDGKSVSLYSPDVYEYLNTTYKDTKYDLIIFRWKPEDYGNEFLYTGGQTFRKKLSNGAYFITVREDKHVPHEIMHGIGQILYVDLKKYDAVDQMDAIVKPDGTVLRYYKNDTPDDPDSNFSITWDSYKKYLPELNNLGKMPTYNHFSEKEVIGLVPSFVKVLDIARELSNTPYKIASGFRTPEQNKAAGGVANSAHLKGLAVDLQCTDNQKRTKILKGLYNCGTPLFIEICGRHIHVDMDSSIHKMGDTIWGNDAT